MPFEINTNSPISSWRTPTGIAIQAMIFLLMAIITVKASAQDREVIEAYEAGRYDEVVDFYNLSDDQQVSRADVALFSRSLTRTGRTQEAVDLMTFVWNSHPNSPVTISALAEALIYNGDHAIAYYLLSEYVDEADEIPDFYDLAEKASLLIDWADRETRLKVKPFSLINSPKNEFSIYKDGDRVVFCSSDVKDLNRNLSIDKRDYTALFSLDDEDQAHVPFNKGSFKGRYNVGPFHMGQDKMYFTFSQEVRPGVNELTIFETDAADPSVAKSKPINISSEDYSICHPTLTPDGKKMIFASDMPGGEGGMDLYYSLLTPVGWSGPISLGSTVNTERNEVFPRLVGDTIYFASDGHPGYGGLDIYKVTDDMYHEDVRNLYAPINSPYDDFDLFIIDDEAGYFTSNRPGGKGGDDIFYYDLIKVKEAPEMVSGILELEGMPRRNVRMLLTDTEGNILEQAYTDDNGVFYFNRRNDGGLFNIKIADEEVDTQAIDLFLTDTQGEKVQKLTADANGNFSFELLAVDDYFIDYMQAEDNSLFSFTLRGIVYRQNQGDTDREISLVSMNDFGIVSGETTTMEHGYFEFDNMYPSNDYYFNILDDDPDLRIAIVDENDLIIKTLKRGDNGRFYYETKEEDMNMISIFNEDNVLINVEVDAAINLDNILYPTARYDLDRDSKTELDRVVGILKNNADLKIELSSHTDCVGDAKENQQLSELRARSAKEYIVSKGVDPTRVNAVGYGEERPLNYCRDGVRCKSEEYAVNRRTEFKIISN